MATLSPVQDRVFEVLGLQQGCAQTLSDEVLHRISLIREKCVQAEKAEGNGTIPWRRPLPNPPGRGPRPGGGGGGGGNQVPNRWRTGPVRPAEPRPSQPRQPHQRYVSQFQNTDTPVEDKILNQVILNKLNKFSASTYEDIKGFLQQILDSDETEFLQAFMLLIFKKASSEPTFCPLYAKMIAELTGSYKTLNAELRSLYTKYLTIFEEVSEDQCKDYETFVQRNREKLQRLGYSQFLAELTSLGALEQADLQMLYGKILEQIRVLGTTDSKTVLVEEYVDCLLCMSKAFQKGSTLKLVQVRTGLAEACVPTLKDIVSNRTKLYPGVSKKAMFGMMDCMDIFQGAVKC